MNNRWFYRLLFSYLPIFFVITSLLVLFSFMSIRWISHKETDRANELFTRQIMKLIDNSLSAIDQKILNETISNTAFRKFFEETEEDNSYTGFLVTTDYIRTLIHTTPLITDLYLFRYEDNAIITRDSRIGLDKFMDREFILSLEGQSLFYRWTDVRTIQEKNAVTNEMMEKTVISLVRKVPILTGKQGLIIVNIQTRQLQRLIHDFSGSDVNLTALYDRRGKEITDMSERRVKHFNPTTMLSSEYTGWTMESAVKKDGWFAFSDAVSVVWFVTWAVVLLIGAIWCIYVTQRNYVPIKTLLHRLSLYPNSKQKGLSSDKKDEFGIIGSALDHLIEQTEHAFKELEETRSLKQKRCFMNLLDGASAANPIDLDSEPAMLFQSPVRIHAVVIEIDGHHEFVQRYSAKDQFLLKFVLQNVWKEISTSRGLRIWSDWVTVYQLTALVFVNDTVGSTDIHGLCEEAHEWVKKNLQYNVSIGVGREVGCHDEIHITYDEALIAMKSKFSQGGNRIFYSQNSPADPRSDLLEPLAIIRRLARSIARAEEQWEYDFGLFLNSIRTRGLNKEDIISLMKLTLVTIDQEMMQFSEQYKELWDREAMVPLQQSLENEDTFDGIGLYYREILGAIHSRLKELREKRGNHEWIMQIRRYIEDNYGNPNLSLMLLETHFQINGSYLSRIFKEEVGIKLNEYMVDVRIHAAKRMIVETQEAIQDIAVKVGYLHTMSFIRVFKKVVGLTPGDFRKRNAS